MAKTPSRFLPVSTHEPFVNQGWIVKVRDYKDFTTLVAVIHEFSAMSFTQELSAEGTGSVSMDKDSPFWSKTLANGQDTTVLIDNEYVFEAWENGACRFAWIGQVRNSTVASEDETRPIELSGPGIAASLKRAIINRPGWPAVPPIVGYAEDEATGKKTIPLRRDVSESDKVPAYLWRFPIKWPTMRMWWAVFQAAQRRGVIPYVNLKFTAYKDSDKKTWKWVQTLDQITNKHGYQPENPNANLLDFLNECTGQDPSKWFAEELEWLMMPGFKLYVRRRIGVDRSSQVRFFGGQILGDTFSLDSSEIYNRVIAVDVEGGESNRTSKTSTARWGIRESRNETNKNVTIPALRDKLADTYIAQTRNDNRQRDLRIPYDAKARRPFRDFQVGDWIGFNDSKHGSRDGVIKKRVMAITVNITADSSVPDVELTLESIQQTRLEALERKLTSLINNPKNIDLSDIADVDADKDKLNSKVGLVWNPKTKKWEPAPYSFDGGGNSVYIQPTDPVDDEGVTVAVGDFWFDTDG